MLRRSPLSPGKKPFKASKPLVRKTPLATRLVAVVGEPRPVRAMRTKARRDTGPDRDIVEAILERAAYSCERCTGAVGPVRGTDWHVHHRRPRAAGGSRRADTNGPANTVILCPDCHHVVESHRADALAEGWLLPQASDPAMVPLLIERGSRWAYLDAAGGYSDNPPNGSYEEGAEVSRG